MTQSTGHLTKLVALAKEKSSDTRRELLRDIAGLFFEPDAPLEGEAAANADAILSQVISDVEASVRAEMADRFADLESPPTGLISELAHDVADVARPLLQRSKALSDELLVSVAQTKGQDHLRAIAAREHVSLSVTDAVVSRADDETLVALTQNEGAQLSRAAMETITDAAERVEELRAPLVQRADTPVDLLNELFPLVEARLRERITERNDALSPDELEAVMAAAQARLARRSGDLPPDYEEASRFIDMKRLRKQVTPALVVEQFQQNQATRAHIAFADLAQLDYAAARRVMENPAIDPLAIACRAGDIRTDDFVKLALFRPTSGARDQSSAEALSAIYDLLPQDVAVRAMRFWRVRKNASSAA